MVLTNVAGVSGSMKKKTTKGRKKIEIKKIEETNSRQVTFSKRRTGLFKKASELCVLTGAHVAILVNSPGGRVFVFGHPNVDGLLDRYLKSSNNNNNNNNKDSTVTTSIATNNNNINNNSAGGVTVGGTTTGGEYCSPPVLQTKEFNQHYVAVSRELEVEKKRREMIPSGSRGGPWFDEPTDGLPVEELEQYLWSLVELKKKVLTRADELMMINKSPAMLGGSNVFEMGWGGFNGGPMVAVPPNAAVHGGFGLQYGGDIGRF